MVLPFNTHKTMKATIQTIVQKANIRLKTDAIEFMPNSFKQVENTEDGTRSLSFSLLIKQIKFTHELQEMIPDLLIPEINKEYLLPFPVNTAWIKETRYIIDHYYLVRYQDPDYLVDTDDQIYAVLTVITTNNHIHVTFHDLAQ